MDFIAFITSLLIFLPEKNPHDEVFMFEFYEVSVLKKHHYLYCRKLLGVKLKMYEKRI